MTPNLILLEARIRKELHQLKSFRGMAALSIGAKNGL